LDNSKSIRQVLISLTILINFILAIYVISKIGYTSELAGSLINLGSKIGIIFRGIGITLICYIFVRLIFKSSFKYNEILSIILVILINALNIKAIVYPKVYTEAEIVENELSELKSMVKRGDRLLEKSENILNDKAIKLEDSTAIISYFKQFLSTPFYRSSDSLKIDYNDKFQYYFNRILINRPYGGVEMIFDSLETNKYRDIMNKNLSVDLFLYSPDKKKMLVVLTYEVGKEPIEANGLVLIGERLENKIILYRYDNFRNDYGVLNKKYALYELITDFDNFDSTSDFNKISPLDKSFWDDGFYEKVKYNNTEKYRYQLDYFAYKWNEKRKFNEKVTEEKKIFIEIER
jgi:hypothetical protein